MARLVIMIIIRYVMSKTTGLIKKQTHADRLKYTDQVDKYYPLKFTSRYFYTYKQKLKIYRLIKSGNQCDVYFYPECIGTWRLLCKSITFVFIFTEKVFSVGSANRKYPCIGLLCKTTSGGRLQGIKKVL